MFKFEVVCRLIDYKSLTIEQSNFLARIWYIQKKTRNNCTGMSSFSFYPEKILFDADEDQCYKIEIIAVDDI